ncbi:hypothetical protein ACFPFX_34190 [Streptomyces mauvecolor]|uniref:Uncharacterized protein n=1 Tax=Streptomyces mauvecolor TaxID=58345 RepID=A0ABV9V0B6_9ACTN
MLPLSGASCPYLALIEAQGRGRDVFFEIEVVAEGEGRHAL